MLFFLFVSWLLTGTPPGVLNAQPGSTGAVVEAPTTPKKRPTVVLPTTASERADPADCCGTDPPPPPRKPGTD